MLALLGGVVFTMVRIVQSPGGVTPRSVLPLVVVLAMIAVVMAPFGDGGGEEDGIGDEDAAAG